MHGSAAQQLLQGDTPSGGGGGGGEGGGGGQGGGERGGEYSQHQLGTMYCLGQGMDSPDYKQALVWYEKAVAQDDPFAGNALGIMVEEGRGPCPSSYRRARELYQRAIGLGCEQAIENMQILQENIRQVISTS